MWDRDEEKVILNLNSNPDGRRLDQKLAGKDREEGMVRKQFFYPDLSQAGKTMLRHPPKAGLLRNFPCWVPRS